MITAVGHSDDAGKTVLVLGLTMDDLLCANRSQILVPMSDLLQRGDPRTAAVVGDDTIDTMAVVIICGRTDEELGIRAAELLGAPQNERDVRDMVALAQEHEQCRGFHFGPDGETGKI